MRHFKKIVTFICVISFYAVISANAANQPTSTVQVTLVPNKMAVSQVNQLFNDSDTAHFEKQQNDTPAFQIGNQS